MAEPSESVDHFATRQLEMIDTLAETKAKTDSAGMPDSEAKRVRLPRDSLPKKQKPDAPTSGFEGVTISLPLSLVLA